MPIPILRRKSRRMSRTGRHPTDGALLTQRVYAVAAAEPHETPHTVLPDFCFRANFASPPDRSITPTAEAAAFSMAFCAVL
ncbi:hypothetical protein DSECCO2_315500 [anaerobic digester metagenome]